MSSAVWSSALCKSFHVNLCLCLCIKMSSFLYMCSHAQCRVHFIHHVEFYFRFRHLITFPAYSQLWHSSQGEKSLTYFSGNTEIYILCKGHLLSKLVLRKRSSCVKGSLPSKFVFCQRSSSVKGCLPSKVVFHQSLSSVKGCLLSKMVFR